jgi:hypothetical protein
MTKTINAMKPVIAGKAIELGVGGSERFDIHLLAERQGLGQPEMDPDAIRDFLMAYLETKNTHPILESQSIAYHYPTQDGVDAGHLARFQWMRFDGSRKQTFKDLVKIYRHFERSGPVRRPTEIEGRPIGECALVLLEHKMGPSWLDAVKSSMRRFYKDSLDPFHRGYRQIGDDVGIKLSGEELLISIDLKIFSYRNSTMSIPDGRGIKLMPETIKTGLIGRSLASIVDGLPNHPCFHETIAIDTQDTIGSYTLKFDERRIPIGPNATRRPMVA